MLPTAAPIDPILLAKLIGYAIGAVLVMVVGTAALLLRRQKGLLAKLERQFLTDGHPFEPTDEEERTVMELPIGGKLDVIVRKQRRHERENAEWFRQVRLDFERFDRELSYLARTQEIIKRRLQNVEREGSVKVRAMDRWPDESPSPEDLG